MMTPGAQGDTSFYRNGVASKLGNGSYVLGVPAVIVDENGKPIPGIVPDSQILAHVDLSAARNDIKRTWNFSRVPSNYP